jgi:hypothetical protein
MSRLKSDTAHEPAASATGEIVALERAVTISARRSRLSRLTARLKSASLDKALIAGANPAFSPALRSRIAILASRRNREATADGLQRLATRAGGTQRRLWSLSNRRVLLANSSRLNELALLLRTERPLYASGLARINQLLTDGLSPMYRGDESTLARALDETAQALRRG